MADNVSAPTPSSEALRSMMARAAATAAAAAGDASTAALAAPPPPPRYVRQHASRSSHNRRQSISHLAPLMASEPLPKGAPLPSTEDGSRWRRIASVAAEIASKWQHPPGSNQYETDTLHHVRAILYMNKSLITQSFVSHVSGVSQGSLSHYVRGLFRGNQQNVEDRLSHFVRKFAAGELDSFLEEARAGSRPLSRALLMDTPAGVAVAASASLPAGQSTMVPPLDSATARDARPPIPPPPPPQLQPAPWTRPPTAPKPPPGPPPPPHASSPSSSAPDSTPPRLLPSSAVPAPTDTALVPQTLDFSPVLSERARRARQRRIAQARAKRGRTPFTSFLEQMSDPTPVVAVERAYHALVAPNWTVDSTHVESLLLPIELFVQHNGSTLHMFTQWDINERTLSPEIVAERIRRARGLPKEIATPAALQIRRALFDAGIICAPPPTALDAENRRLIRIEVELTGPDRYQLLRDEFEWDLGIGSINSPELFAQYMCSDASISQKHAPAVASAIRRKLLCAHAIAYGDAETKRLALESLDLDDPLRTASSSVASALERTPKQERIVRSHLEHEIADTFIIPLIDEIVAAGSKRRRNNENLKQKDEASGKDLERMRATEMAEAAARQEKLEVAYKEVEDAAVKLQAERGLDFRPYLAIKMARGERPGVWTPGVFDRKRRRQTSFPMIQPSRIKTSLLPTGPRHSRRRRATRRGEGSESRDDTAQENDRKVRMPGMRKQVKREAGAMEGDTQPEVLEAVLKGSDYKVRLVLRVREPQKKESRSSGSGSTKKRRRR